MTKPNPRRQNGHRRTQLINRIKQRDTHCWLCHKPVDTSLPPRLDTSPEIHELIPVSRGGNPLDPNNCVLTHRACNRWISNSTPAEVAQRLTTSHTTPHQPPATTLTW